MARWIDPNPLMRLFLISPHTNPTGQEGQNLIGGDDSVQRNARLRQRGVKDMSGPLRHGQFKTIAFSIFPLASICVGEMALAEEVCVSWR